MTRIDDYRHAGESVVQYPSPISRKIPDSRSRSGVPVLKISVITAVRNNHGTVGAALDSVLAQSHADVEMVVIDGASTDGTLQVLQRYRDRIAVLVSEPDSGIYDALNKGLAHASGDVIGFLHADDLLADSGVLTDVAAAFAAGADGVYGDLLYVNKQDPAQIVRYWRGRMFTPSRTRSCSSALSWGIRPSHA